MYFEEKENIIKNIYSPPSTTANKMITTLSIKQTITTF